MSGITTHVLDTSRGRPAGGVSVRLEIQEEKGWREIGHALTHENGRADLLPVVATGIYRLIFEIETWFRTQEIEGFFPEAVIVFHVRDANQHYHVPLLLSPYGYTTYRGS